MKKWIALILAAALLLACAAAAEPVTSAVFANPVLEMSQGDETFTVDMAGLRAELKGGMNGGVPTLRVDVDDGGEKLLGGTAQFSGGALLFELDGMDRTYKLPMNDGAGGMTAQMGYEKLFASLDEVFNARVPAFPGATVPKLTLPEALLDAVAPAGAQVGADGTKTYAVDVDYTQIHALLDQLAPALSSLPQTSQVSQLTAMIGMLKLTKSGFNLKGSVVDAADRLDVDVEVTLVESGQPAPEPSIALALSSAENQDALTLRVRANGQWQELGTLELISAPEAAMLTVTLEAMDGSGFTFSLFPEDGMQMAVLGVDAGGTEFSLYYSYGGRGDADCVYLGAESADDFEVNLGFETVCRDGVHDGAFSVKGGASGTDFDLAGDFSLAAPVAALLPGVTDAAGAVDLTTLDEAGLQAFSAELSEAAAGLMNYLQGLEMRPAA